MAIEDLSTHPKRYVKVGDLAEYWDVSPQMLYKQITAGTLKADRIGPRLYRIAVTDARKFAAAARLPVVPNETSRSRSKRTAKATIRSTQPKSQAGVHAKR